MVRAVAPGIPHHVTQRGNRRQQTLFIDEDYPAYLELMAEWCMKYTVEIWAYCLMPNPSHLIAIPKTKDGLNLAISAPVKCADNQSEEHFGKEEKGGQGYTFDKSVSLI